ncbi:lactonase family protein [Paenibacillus rhizovicinus]|uniref:Lactonase family protein n=1 Tax=Paenibacillus rhizovicinus TaxID=2704463 RepID=A0A6C0P662_9BACL|nr:lactonase family protein [Paenibacillus rhizovicinus]QHW34009.1 lactonase family protein [Paenibacillus rhizovicinus]
MATTIAFIGSYADADGPGVYACAYDEHTGVLTQIGQTNGLQNPTFLVPDGENRMLYTIMESKDAEGRKYGAAAAYRFDPANGSLLRLNEEMTLPATTCHISLDRTRKFAMTASYHGGMVSLSPILSDGRIGPTADIHRHEGSSVHPAQTQARAHSVIADRAGRYAVVSDLGLDKLFVYELELEPQQPRMTLRSETSIAPGSGPRHFVFHPELPYGYGINELNSTVTVYAYDAEAGQLEVLQTISTLPESFEGENGCADIHLSPDGKFLYGSNRGHDSLVVYRVDPASGRIETVEYAPTLGGHPRNFALSPDGRFALVANRDGNNIVTFSRDAETGKLQPTGSELRVSKPVCIRFAEIDG